MEVANVVSTQAAIKVDWVQLHSAQLMVEDIAVSTPVVTGAWSREECATNMGLKLDSGQGII
jgi:hypothetical protein